MRHYKPFHTYKWLWMVKVSTRPYLWQLRIFIFWTTPKYSTNTISLNFSCNAMNQIYYHYNFHILFLAWLNELIFIFHLLVILKILVESFTQSSEMLNISSMKPHLFLSLPFRKTFNCWKAIKHLVVHTNYGRNQLEFLSTKFKYYFSILYKHYRYKYTIVYRSIGYTIYIII